MSDTPMTGYKPGLLQDDSRELSRALASKPDARMPAREAAEAHAAAASPADAAQAQPDAPWFYSDTHHPSGAEASSLSSEVSALLKDVPGAPAQPIQTADDSGAVAAWDASVWSGTDADAVHPMFLDGYRAALAAQPVAVQPPDAQVAGHPGNADEFPHELADELSANRYRVIPAKASLLGGYAVVVGNGTWEIYQGRKGDCVSVAAKLRGAFLDGMFAIWDQAMAAPQAAPEPLTDDTKRIDYLSTQCVVVRSPLRYGSRENFRGAPDDDDGECVPWDIRAAIDKANAGTTPATAGKEGK